MRANYDYVILDIGYTSRIPKKLGKNLVVKKINSVIEYGCYDHVDDADDADNVDNVDDVDDVDNVDVVDDADNADYADNVDDVDDADNADVVDDVDNVDVVDDAYCKKTNNHLVCIKDDIWGKYNDCTFVLYGDKEDYDFVNSIVKADGYILLKNVNMQSVHSLIEYFSEERNQFCSSCSVSGIYEMDLYTTIDNKTILFVAVDTESG